MAVVSGERSDMHSGNHGVGVRTRQKITFSLTDWMKLPDSFGAKEGQYMGFSVTSMEQVMNISQKVIDFCMKQGISRRKSNMAGLAVEEMAGNTVKHGFREDRKNYVDVRIQMMTRQPT